PIIVTWVKCSTILHTGPRPYLDPESFKHNLSDYSSRPTATAIFRMSCISSLNWLGLMDSSPSHSAHSGFEWTSIRMPSAPAATAAFDIGATRFHLPVAWLGSTMT